MLFSEKTRIEEYIIEILDQKTHTGPDLIEVVQKEKPGTTREAIYAVLKKLVENEVITKGKKFYSLNRYWLQKVHEFSRRHIESTHAIDAANILDFEDGDKITYEFKNPFLLDIYWGHLYDIVYEAHNKSEPLLNFHPHEWLAHARPETEAYFLNRFNNDGKMILFSIGNTTPLGKQFKKDWSSDHVKINTGINYGLKNNQYLSVVGDFIFEVSTTVGFGEDIDNFFNKHSKITPENQETLMSLVRKRSRSKLVFSRNKKKALAWKEKIRQRLSHSKGVFPIR